MDVSAGGGGGGMRGVGGIHGEGSQVWFGVGRVVFLESGMDAYPALTDGLFHRVATHLPHKLGLETSGIACGIACKSVHRARSAGKGGHACVGGWGTCLIVFRTAGGDDGHGRGAANSAYPTRGDRHT